MTRNRAASGRQGNLLFSGTKNYLKLVLIFLLGILFVISIIVMLLAYFNQKKTAAVPAETSSPETVRAASETIASLLAENKLQFVKDYSNKEKYLEVKVDNALWKKISAKERKKFIMEISAAQGSLGLRADVRVIDYRSGIELAAAERGRVALAGHDD